MFSNVSPAVSMSSRPICALAVDAEEDFDWDEPFRASHHSTGCMRNVRDLQEIVGAYGVVPTYLLTYPVLDDDKVVQILRHQAGRGQCELGVQLHPWVNPPFDRTETARSDLGASFSGNLRPGVEERKLVELRRRFIQRFDAAPRIYRAGRYGLGAETPGLLEKYDFAIDTSVAPRTSFSNEGGPDHSGYDYRGFWFGEKRRLLELPLCRSVVGWGGRLAAPVYRRLTAPALRRLHISSAVTRLRFAERITLSPEGNDASAMLRLVRYLLARGQTIFVLSFHSSSLAVGRNPYVRSRAELHAFYDRLSAVLDIMASQMKFTFASLAELPGHLQAPPG